jgi:hypothetical protein
MTRVTVPVGLAVAAAIAGAGCRQLFGIDDTVSAGADGAVAIDAASVAIDGAPDATPPPDAVVAPCPGYMQLAAASPPGATYRGIDVGRTWNDARTMCQADGADLVVVDDAQEAAAVATLVQDDASPYLWVGVSLVGGAWTSVRGGPATYLPWAPGQPTGGANSCALIEDVAPNQLYDFACIAMQVFVCECLP